MIRSRINGLSNVRCQKLSSTPRLPFLAPHYTYETSRSNRKSRNRQYYGGINTTVRWKGISLGVFCNYVIKRTFWNGFLSDRMNGGVYSAGGWGNVSGPALDFGGLKYYTTPGQQADLPTLIATNHMDNRHIAHEIYTDNGSFFRVKNISMSYEFPTALVNKIKLQRLRVYGYMDNVWVFSKSKTYPDPENINTNGYANGSEYPLPHKFTLGAEITF